LFRVFSAPLLFYKLPASPHNQLQTPDGAYAKRRVAALPSNGNAGKQISFAKYIEKWIQKIPPPFSRGFRRIQQGRFSLLHIFAVFFKKERPLVIFSNIYKY